MALTCAVVVSLLSGPVRGWGYDVHRRINRQAARILDGPLGRFSAHHQQRLSLYAPVADFIKGTYPGEVPRHYMDADLYDSYPFARIPYQRDSLIAAYGQSNLDRWGILPWAIAETCERVTRLMTQDRWEEALFYMAVLGHYVADLHMPLHVVENYNGQLSGNDGVHFRWESRMVDELIPRFRPVGTVAYLEDPLEQAFSVLRESFQVHEVILAADRQARQVLTVEQAAQLTSYQELPFEGPYLRLLYRHSHAVAHDRLGRAVTQVASYWYTCWVKAGSPPLPTR